jgi:hypothetical protein
MLTPEHRFSEVLTRCLVPPRAKRELAKCRGVEWICGQAIVIGNGACLFEPALWPLVLCDRDGPNSISNGCTKYQYSRKGVLS